MVRQQLVQLRGWVVVEPHQDVGQVGHRVDPVRLAGRRQRVQSGQGLPGFLVSHKQEVLTAQGRRGIIVRLSSGLLDSMP